MKKRIWIYIACVACMIAATTCFAGCAPDDSGALTMIAPDGATALAAAQTAHVGSIGGKAVDVSIVPADQVAARAKDADMAILPANEAATLIGAGLPYAVAGIVTSGNLYMIGTDDSVREPGELVGKQVVSIGQGKLPEFIFRALLLAEGIATNASAGGVTLEYANEGSAVIARLMQARAQGKSMYGIVGEPAVSAAVGKGLVEVLDLQSLWQSHTDSAHVGYAQAVLIVRNELLADRDWAAALDAWMQTNADYLSQHADEAIGAVRAIYPQTSLPQTLPARVIERCNVGYAEMPASRAILESTLRAVYELQPAAVGGKMPEDAFYRA